MTYKFSLEPVLKHRKLLEETLQKDFGDLRKQWLDEKEQLHRLKKKQDHFSKELQQKQATRVNVSEMLLYNAFIARISKEIDKQLKKIEETEKRVEKKREELVAAMKNRKTIERLGERHLQIYMKNLLKKEQELMNEAAINVFNKR